MARKSASLAQIKTMLTFCVRGERFCDGHWGAMVSEGRIGAILHRLSKLRVEAPVRMMAYTWSLDGGGISIGIQNGKVVSKTYSSQPKNNLNSSEVPQ